MVAPMIEKSIRARVPCGEILIDHTYQRDPASAAHIERLAKTWNDNAAGVIYLSLRADGHYYAIDGQRRAAACEQANGPQHELEARVYIDLTQQEEAELFGLFQQREALTPYDKFKAAKMSGDASALAVETIVEGAGLRLASSSGVNTLTCIVDLFAIYEIDEGGRLRTVLELLKAGFDKYALDSRTPYTSQAVRGLSHFLARWPLSENAYIARRHRIRISDVLEKIGPLALANQAVAVRSGTSGAGTYAMSPSIAWALAFHKDYNRDLRSGRLGAWPKGKKFKG